jgi:hypothetical protein
LSPSGYLAINTGLKRSQSLRRLSFAGSRMGDDKASSPLRGQCCLFRLSNS